MANTPNLSTHVPHDFVAVTLDTTYDPPARGFRTAAAGDVSVMKLDGTICVLIALTAGETFRGMIKQITTADTTVADPTENIVMLF